MGQALPNLHSCCDIVCAPLEDELLAERQDGSVASKVGSFKQHRPVIKIDDALKDSLKNVATALACKDFSSIGSLVKRLWPRVAPELSRSIETSMRQSISVALTRLPKGVRGEARLGVVAPSGDVEIGPIYGCRSSGKRLDGKEVSLRLRFNTNTDLELRLGTAGLMLSRLGFDGDASLTFYRDVAVSDSFAIGGIRLGFINPPDVRLGLKEPHTSETWSSIDACIRHMVNSIFRNAFVVPRFMAVPFSDDLRRNLAELQSPLPRLALHIQITQARGLSVFESSSIGAATVPNPYLCLRLGACEFRTPTCYKTCDPAWENVGGDFFVHDERQHLQLDAFTANSSVGDNLLGSLPLQWSVSSLLKSQAEARAVACSGSRAGIWLPLQNRSQHASGAVRLSIQAFGVEEFINLSVASDSSKILVSVRLFGVHGLLPGHVQGAAVRLTVEGRTAISNEARWFSTATSSQKQLAWEETLYIVASSPHALMHSGKLELRAQDFWLPLVDQDGASIFTFSSTSSAKHRLKVQQYPGGESAFVEVSWGMRRMVQKVEGDALAEFSEMDTSVHYGSDESREVDIHSSPLDLAASNNTVVGLSISSAVMKQNKVQKKAVRFDEEEASPASATMDTASDSVAIVIDESKSVGSLASKNAAVTFASNLSLQRKADVKLSRGSAGMNVISEALRDNPFAWGDGAGEWHPALRPGCQPTTRCWGPMHWSDGVDAYS